MAEDQDTQDGTDGTADMPAAGAVKDEHVAYHRQVLPDHAVNDDGVPVDGDGTALTIDRLREGYGGTDAAAGTSTGTGGALRLPGSAADEAALADQAHAGLRNVPRGADVDPVPRGADALRLG